MHDITTQVMGVSGRKTRNGSDIYDVALADGNTYTTFDGALAGKASALYGQGPVTARVDISPSKDGKYTNQNLEDIALAGQLPAMAMPAPAPGTQIQPGTPIGPQPQPVPTTSGVSFTPVGEIPKEYQRDFSPEAQKRVAFFAAAQAAAAFVGGLYSGLGPEGYAEAEVHLKKATQTLLEGAAMVAANQPQAAPTPVADVTPTEATPGAVADAVNTAAGGEAVTTGLPNW